MATIDPATFLGLDEELGGDRARPPRDAQRPVRARRVAARSSCWSTARSSPATARCSRPRPRSPGRAGRASTAPAHVHAADRHAAGGALRERRDQPPRRPRGAARRPPGRARRPRRHVDHPGRDRELPRHARVRDHRDHVLELLVLGTDPAAMARAAARVAEMGGGFAFDGGWSAPLEIDGLIAARRLRARARDRARADARRCSARAIRSTIRCTPCCSPPATSCRRSGLPREECSK